jgi:hypothetical protein
VDRPKLDCNIHSVLDTSLTQRQVAELFLAHGWTVHKSSWTDHYILCSWAELYLDGEGEILMHGPIADPLAHAEELFVPLRQAGVRYWGEFYGADTELLEEFSG